MDKKTTNLDVARRAGVSTATVSRVLNNSPSVREATRHRVLQAMDELDYRPNPAARKLSAGRSFTIAVILPLITLPSFVERLRGIHDYLSAQDYDIVLYSVDTAEKRDRFLTRLAHPATADGLLLVSLPPTEEQVSLFRQSGIPVVLVDANHPCLHRVRVDDREGGRLATEHLVSKGHHRIAYLSDFLDTPFHPSMRERFEGYRDVLAAHGIPFNPAYAVSGPHDRFVARQLAEQLFGLAEPPTAIFAASDTQAIGVLDAAFHAHIHVPNQLSVIGFDGIRDSEYVHLTTVQQPLYESGYFGAEMLLQLVRSEITEIRELILPVEIIERRTTASPASG